MSDTPKPKKPDPKDYPDVSRYVRDARRYQNEENMFRLIEPLDQALEGINTKETPMIAEQPPPIPLTSEQKENILDCVLSGICSTKRVMEDVDGLEEGHWESVSAFLDEVDKHLETMRSRWAEETSTCGHSGCVQCDLETKVSKEEADKTLHDWQQGMLDKYGWYSHHVNDPEVGMGANYHTHGLSDRRDHLDLQLVCPLPMPVSQMLFYNVVTRIEAGEKFKHGDTADRIASGFPVKFVDAEEGERSVLRIILPDKEGNLDPDTMNPRFALQYPGQRKPE